MGIAVCDAVTRGAEIGQLNESLINKRKAVKRAPQYTRKPHDGGGDGGAVH
jgi:hypothetical protein